MKNLSSIVIKIFLFITLMSLLGCNAQASAVATVDPQVYVNTVSAAKTEAVQSAYLQLTQTAAARPSATFTQMPTNTPEATKTATMTMTAVPATLVPTRMITLTQAPTVEPTQGAYQCSITRLEPKSGAALTKGTDFDLSVTLKNIGTEKWLGDTVDFKYLSGTKFQKKVDALDLPADVEPGNSIELVIDMVAPNKTETLGASWGLVRSSASFCTVNISVNVK
jgi:hypothetical protein